MVVYFCSLSKDISDSKLQSLQSKEMKMNAIASNDIKNREAKNCRNHFLSFFVIDGFSHGTTNREMRILIHTTQVRRNRRTEQNRLVMPVGLGLYCRVDRPLLAW